MNRRQLLVITASLLATKQAQPKLCIFNTHPQMQERIQRLDGLAKTYRFYQKQRKDSEAFRYLKSLPLYA